MSTPTKKYRGLDAAQFVARYLPPCMECRDDRPNFGIDERIDLQVRAGKHLCRQGRSPDEVADVLSLPFESYEQLVEWYKEWSK